MKINKEMILNLAHLNRILAKLVDFAIVVICTAIFPRVLGPLLGFLYSLLADGMHFGPFKAQSVGKKIFDLEVVSTVRGTYANYRDSVIRNSPMGLATFFAIIPVWGWIILILIGIPLLIMEIYLMERMEKGHRLGDVMADTEVRSAKPT